LLKLCAYLNSALIVIVLMCSSVSVIR